MKLELSSLRIKVDLLEAKSIENVDLLTTRILKQEEEIIKLKAKIDAKLDADGDIHSTGENNTSSIIKSKENLVGYCSIINRCAYTYILNVFGVCSPFSGRVL